MSDTDTDIVALSERYGELLSQQHAAATPAEQAWIRIQLVLIELQMHGACTEFFT